MVQGSQTHPAAWVGYLVNNEHLFKWSQHCLQFSFLEWKRLPELGSVLHKQEIRVKEVTTACTAMGEKERKDMPQTHQPRHGKPVCQGEPACLPPASKQEGDIAWFELPSKRGLNASHFCKAGLIHSSTQPSFLPSKSLTYRSTFLP